MGRSIRDEVHVVNPETHAPLVLLPGTPEGDVPGWARDRMGDHVWDDSPVADERTAMILGRLRANGAPEPMVDELAANLTDDERIVEALVATSDNETVREAVAGYLERHPEPERAPDPEAVVEAEPQPQPEPAKAKGR